MVLSLLLACSAAFAAAEDFTGKFEWVGRGYGACEHQLQGFLSTGLDGHSREIWLGQYYFPYLNGGWKEYDDEIATSRSRSTLNGSLLVWEQYSFHKIRRTHERSRVEARLTGSRLRVDSRSSGPYGTEKTCTYRQVSRGNPEPR